MADFVKHYTPKVDSMNAATQRACQEVVKTHHDRLRQCAETENNADGNEWSLLSEHEDLNLRIYGSVVPGNGLKMFKATCSYEGQEPKDIYEFLMDNETRLGWDANVCHLDTTVLLENSPEDKIVALNCRTNAVGPISGRDFVDVCHWVTIPAKEAGGDYPIYMSAGATATESNVEALIKEVYPEPSGYVRGANFPGCGWHVTASKNGEGKVVTLVTYIIHTDLKGWFPKIVVNNAIAGSYVDFFKNSSEAMKTYKKE